MSNASVTVLWVYIVLLVVGGTIGFIKAGSKVSLITSVLFGAALALCALGIIKSVFVAGGILLTLTAVFTIRYNKTKKFMPSGLLVILSVGALLALCVLR